ncbi:hypothetical protein HG536_0D02780 [Torulaspora globosa]|uniref:Uncharacterized protein n=1 Tax=Torulaspora globosa TaxID=48254 RepID=A0A7G3ZGX0_9SACH|nr:uncharacterized protein HG536_0D02780 [Torulaspora globosa]QLL32756.1 hypothetical protein HG536_0D02780 [Torulaspora globosa]
MKAQAVTPKRALRQTVQACVLLLAIYLILRHFLVCEYPFRWFKRNFRALAKLAQQEALTAQDGPSQIISDPVFDVEDANPIDTTRLVCFLLVCCACVVPFLY